MLGGTRRNTRFLHLLKIHTGIYSIMRGKKNTNFLLLNLMQAIGNDNKTIANVTMYLKSQ